MLPSTFTRQHTPAFRAPYCGHFFNHKEYILGICRVLFHALCPRPSRLRSVSQGSAAPGEVRTFVLVPRRPPRPGRFPAASWWPRKTLQAAGSFGRVFKATVDDVTSVAVKAILTGFTWENLRYFSQVTTPGDCEQECQMLAVLKHPNILGLLGSLTALICRIPGASLPSTLRLPSLHLIILLPPSSPSLGLRSGEFGLSHEVGAD